MKNRGEGDYCRAKREKLVFFICDKKGQIVYQMTQKKSSSYGMRDAGCGEKLAIRI